MSEDFVVRTNLQAENLSIEAGRTLLVAGYLELFGKTRMGEESSIISGGDVFIEQLQLQAPDGGRTGTVYILSRNGRIEIQESSPFAPLVLLAAREILSDQPYQREIPAESTLSPFDFFPLGIYDAHSLDY